MNATDNAAPVPGEWLFRCCAYGLSWLVAGLPAWAIFIAFLVLSPVLPAIRQLAGPAILLTWLIAWSGCYLLPLKSRGQTVGMKWFGLRMVASDGRPPTLPLLLCREAVQLVVLGLTAGTAAVLWALLGSSELTLFDRLFGTRVLRCPARLRFVEEFRAFRAAGEDPGASSRKP